VARRGGFTIGRGAASLEVSGELTRAVERVIREFAPTVVAAVEREVEQIVTEAEKEWPVGDDKNGKGARNKRQPFHSVDRFITGIRYVGSDTVEGYIDNDAVNIRGRKYWWFIKTGKTGQEYSPLQKYVRKPVREAAQKLAVELAADLKQMVREA